MAAPRFRTNDCEEFSHRLGFHIDNAQTPGELADLVTEAAQFIEGFNYQGDSNTHINNATETICTVARLLANRVAALEAKLAEVKA